LVYLVYLSLAFLALKAPDNVISSSHFFSRVLRDSISHIRSVGPSVCSSVGPSVTKLFIRRFRHFKDLLANSKILLKILACLPVCLLICSTFCENADARDLGLMTLFLSEMHFSFAAAIYSLCGSAVVVVVFVVVVICLPPTSFVVAVVVATSAVSKYIVHSIGLSFQYQYFVYRTQY